LREQPADNDWSRAFTCVAAAEGDAAALALVADSAALNDLARASRLQPALALAAERLSVEPHDEWRRQLQSAMTAWLLVERTAARVSEVLAAAGVRWAPIKGFDVGRRFYEPREQRSTSDLDLLIDTASLPRARQALESAGWSGLETGRRLERYLREEGYAWQAVGEASVLLEVHFRLWGAVPEGLEDEVLMESLDALDPGGGRRLTPAHAFVLGAVHGWTQDLPRSLNDWRDLDRIARQEPRELAANVVAITRRWSLQLPVALSAAVVERLWSGDVSREILAALTPDLQRGEERLLRQLSADGIDAVSWSRIVWARLMAGRPSRAGWRTVWRRIWAHPGEVERVTPGEWSWARRRWHHLGMSVGRR